jgi:hypothetical protein
MKRENKDILSHTKLQNLYKYSEEILQQKGEIQEAKKRSRS